MKSLKETLKEKNEVKLSRYQARYLLQLVEKDRKYSEKKNIPVSKEVEGLSNILIEVC